MKAFKNITIIFLTCLLSCLIVYAVRLHTYKDGIPVLGYHNVLEDTVKDTYYKDNMYVMRQSTFEKEMKYLYDNHYQTLTMDEVYAYFNGEYTLPEKCVVLTFDDGFKSFDTIVKPILEKYDLHATCFVVTSKLEKENSNDVGKYQYLRKEDIVDTKHVSYASHSHNLHKTISLTKKKMQVASIKEIKNDLLASKKYVNVDYYAFPYGRSSTNARQVLEDMHVKLAFGYGQNRNAIKEDNIYNIPRYIMFDAFPISLFEYIIK